VSALAIVLVEGLGFLALAVMDWRDLHKKGARRAAIAALAGATVLAELGPLSYFLDGWPLWLRLLSPIPLMVLSFMTRRLIEVTGGPLPLWQIAAVVTRIEERWKEFSSRDRATEADELWMTQESLELDRWRSAETDELVDLCQAMVEDIMGAGLEPVDVVAARFAARNARIAELGAQISGRRRSRNHMQ
jgi:hypothetical protein